MTKYFTEGVFTKIVKEQKKTYDNLFVEYDEDKDINKDIEQLAKDNDDIVSFDKITPSLLFFHEGNVQGFSIISNKKEVDEEYKDFYKLINFQVIDDKRKKILPQYDTDEFKKDNKLFLKKLKVILDINNPIKKNPNMEKKEKDEKKNIIKEEEEEEESEEEEIQVQKNKEEIKIEGKKEEKEEEKLSLEEITDNYVITADNFVKMIFILLRIRANIPVILMGETGCGKTSLIRKLSELLNNGSKTKMKILNIHAGTTDKDIIKFLKKKVIKQAE